MCVYICISIYREKEKHCHSHLSLFIHCCMFMVYVATFRKHICVYVYIYICIHSLHVPLHIICMQPLHNQASKRACPQRITRNRRGHRPRRPNFSRDRGRITTTGADHCLPSQCKKWPEMEVFKIGVPILGSLCDPFRSILGAPDFRKLPDCWYQA